MKETKGFEESRTDISTGATNYIASGGVTNFTNVAKEDGIATHAISSTEGIVHISVIDKDKDLYYFSLWTAEHGAYSDLMSLAEAVAELKDVSWLHDFGKEGVINLLTVKPEPINADLKEGQYIYYDMHNPKNYEILDRQGIADSLHDFWENDGGEDAFDTEEDFEMFLGTLCAMDIDQLKKVASGIDYWFDDNEEDFLAHVASVGGWNIHA